MLWEPGVGAGADGKALWPPFGRLPWGALCSPIIPFVAPTPVLSAWRREHGCGDVSVLFRGQS